MNPALRAKPALTTEITERCHRQRVRLLSGKRLATLACVSFAFSVPSVLSVV